MQILLIVIRVEIKYKYFFEIIIEVEFKYRYWNKESTIFSYRKVI